jgi:hypothetical protein
VTVTDCSQRHCRLCTPGGYCERWGACGILFADSGAQNFIRLQVRAVVLDDDETKCANQHQLMPAYSDASACIFKP